MKHTTHRLLSGVLSTLTLLLALPLTLVAQEKEPSSIDVGPLQHSVFDRPFVAEGQRASVGGYAEANYNFTQEDGVTEGPSLEFRRFNLFIFSPIGPRMRFLSELEFEHGTEEIKIETAQLDLEFAPELIGRAGIILSPIGAFNQGHDSPRWDFIERPLVSTTLIPSTFSEVGAGIHGVLSLGPLDCDYQLYLTQGLADGVLDNNLGRTSIPAGRAESLFEEDINGEPALTGRAALRYEQLAELGLSAWHGAYNTYALEGDPVTARRALTISALDFSFTPENFELRGEFAWAQIDVPDDLVTSFGDQQWGFHIDAVVPILHTVLLDLPSTVQLGARFEHVDYNTGNFTNGDPAGEEVTRATLSLALRPGTETVFRLNYGQEWTTDLVGNAPARAAHLQLGFATYF